MLAENHINEPTLVVALAAKRILVSCKPNERTLVGGHCQTNASLAYLLWLLTWCGGGEDDVGSGVEIVAWDGDGCGSSGVAEVMMRWCRSG
nr:hypothetical protein [Tanacetum cinerariifolium]